MIISGSKNSFGTKHEPTKMPDLPPFVMKHKSSKMPDLPPFITNHKSTKMPDLPPFITDDIGFINCDDEDDCNEKITKTTGK